MKGQPVRREQTVKCLTAKRTYNSVTVQQTRTQRQPFLTSTSNMQIEKLFFYPGFPVFDTALLFGKVTRLVLCASVNSKIWMKVSLEKFWNYSERGKTELLGEKNCLYHYVHHAVTWTGLVRL